MYLFETILLIDGVPQHLNFHEERTNRSRAQLFGMQSRLSLDKVAKSETAGLSRCKIVYAEDIVSVEVRPHKPKPISSLRLIESGIEYSHKHLDRTALDALFRQKSECDDVLIVKNGLIADTTTTNVAFLTTKNGWITPKIPLLLGTTRARLVQDGFLKEVDIKAEEVFGFKEIAIMNALRGFESIGSVKEALK